MTPLLIYDGDCDFCAWWVRYWQQLTGPAVRYAPYQEVAARARAHLERLADSYATPTREALRNACGRSARKRIRSPWLSSWHSFSIRSSTCPWST